MVTLLLGIHDHQPVGNFGDVLERAYRQAYKPFLDVVERHSAIKVNLHHSGILYEWLEENHPDYLERVAKLVREGRVEIMGGGFYEPILAALPEKDQQGQIAKMREYIRAKFGSEAKGFWLAERVWEPQLPKVLAKAAMEYTVLDDTHFHAVGFADSELRGHFLTEAEGAAVRVFPISQRLRYLMPYSAPEEVINYLRTANEQAGGRDIALVMADDGEKFGLWPRTYETCYEEGWLDRLFKLVAENSSWLKTATFSERLAASPPLGWAYLPTTSYSELSEWALPEASSRELSQAMHQAPPEEKRFMRGGYFRNFLSKYPEANRLYRKMLRVSGKVHSLEPARKGRKAPDGMQTALGHLWKGQCNCAYWHGVFGGLYLPHLRRAIYENLIKAEAEAERLKGGAKGSVAPFSVGSDDWDGDGVDEVFVDGPAANWYLTRKGGGLWEWDLKARGVNLGGVVSRRKEAYHEKIRMADAARGQAGSIHDVVRVKESGLDRELCYDWHPRMSLLDHFLHPDTSREGFAAARYGEQGDFVLTEYKVTKPELDNGSLKLSLERQGTVWVHSRAVPVRVVKDLTFSPRGGGWSCRYSLENLSSEAAEVWFGAELAFAFSTANAAPAGDESGVAVKTFKDEHLGLALKLRLDAPMDLWSFPLYTISQSEEGFEKTYQGSVMLLHRRVNLLPGAPVKLGVGVEAEP